MVPSSLDSSIRDVPPSTLAPDEKVEQPSVGTFRVTDRQRSPLLEAEQNTAPAAGRTGPLPLDTMTRWGRIGAVIAKGGERYYMMEAKNGAVSLMPADVVEDV